MWQTETKIETKRKHATEKKTHKLCTVQSASTELCQCLSNKIKERLSKCQPEPLMRLLGVHFLVKPCEKL